MKNAARRGRKGQKRQIARILLHQSALRADSGRSAIETSSVRAFGSPRGGFVTMFNMTNAKKMLRRLSYELTRNWGAARQTLLETLKSGDWKLLGSQLSEGETAKNVISLRNQQP